jgi:hypothetical protein
MSRVPSKKLLLDLPRPLADRLKEVAEECGGTQLGIIRLALEIYLRQTDPTESERFVIKLPKTTAESVAAFRQVHNYPDRVKLIETALLNHIDQECERDQSLRPLIEQAKKVQLSKRIHEIKEARAEGE